VDTVGVTALPSEDSVSERRRKLEFLEMQEELIKVGYLFDTCSSIFLVSQTQQSSCICILMVSLQSNKILYIHS